MAIPNTAPHHIANQSTTTPSLPPLRFGYELDASDHSATSTSSSSSSGSYVHSYKKRELPCHSQYVAMDCEMVGGVTGESICARVVLVDWKGRALLDSYVAPVEPVTDYRTYVSGITAENLLGAPKFEDVREQVLQLLKDKILVGHALVNDLQCLKISHPQGLIRDTAVYAPFQRTYFDGQLVPRKLKDLAAEKLGQKIQDPTKPHDPHEDAVAALNLYKQHRPRWEACISSQVQKELKQQRRMQRIQYQQQVVLARQQQYFYNMMMMQQQQQQQQQVHPQYPPMQHPPIMSVTY